MKRILTVLLSLCLLTLAAAGLAELPDMTPVTLEEMGITMQLPVTWAEQELTEEDIEDEMIGFYYDENALCGMLAYASVFGEDVSLEELAESLREEYDVVDVIEVSEIGFVAVADKEDDLFSFFAMSEGGEMLYMLMFSPLSMEDMPEIVGTAMDSIQLVE